MNNGICELEEARCPLGCDASSHPITVGRDLLHDLPGEYTIVSCDRCGTMRTSPRPTPAAIGYYYPPDYGPYLGTVVDDDAAPANGFKAKLIAKLKALLSTRATDLPPIPVGRALEVGCASGSFLRSLAQKGWQVEGIEYSPDAAATARALGYPVHVGAIEGIDLPEGQFDLIVGWMVLEHLHDPVGSLRKLARWAKPKASLAISVPNAGAAEFRIFGRRWYALQLPTHLTHFTPDSARRVMAIGGWRVTRIQHHRNMGNAIASLGYVLRDRGWRRIGEALVAFPERGGRLGAGMLFPISWMMAKLGQTGRMTIWAERAD